MRRLSLLIAPVALAACAAAPPVAAVAAPASPASPRPAAASAAPAEKAASADKKPGHPADAEERLLARIDEATREFELVQRSSGARRPRVQPAPFQLAELPIAHVEPPLQASDPPLAAMRRTELASDLALEKSGVAIGSQQNMTASLKDHAFGLVVVGDAPLRNLSLNRTTASPGSMTCGLSWPRFQPARWMALRRVGDGQLEYSVTDGWFDTSECKIWVERKATVTARSILPGELLYAFRDCKPSPDGKVDCEGQGELTLLFPNAQSVVAGGIGGEVRGLNSAFGVATIPIRRGGGGSVFIRLDPFGESSWRDGFQDRRARVIARGGETGLGVEVSQGVDDPEAIAIAYLSLPVTAPDPFALAERPLTAPPLPSAPKAFRKDTLRLGF